MRIVPVIALCVSLAGAASPNDREALKSTLDNVLTTTALSKARVGLQVVSLDDGSVVYARDPHELLNPASNVKLFTAAAALVRLGSEYRFDTEFYVDRDWKEGKTKALYIRGKGDPYITTERLYGMVADLVHNGVKEVGDLVLDDSWFESEVAPGFDQETGDRAYLSPTGALSLNWNTVAIHLRPGDRAGDKAAVEVEPMSDYFVVEGSVVTGTKTQRRFTVSSARDKDNVRQKVSAEGVVPVDKGTWSNWRKVDEPALYFGYTVKELFKQRGVKVKGKVKRGLVPKAGVKLLQLSQSESLDIVLKRLNKNSSNFVAEQLIKTLGAQGGEAGTHARGIAVVEDFLAREVGIARGTYVMKNGSGLNDTNRFSPAQTNKLLVFMERRFETMPEFMSSLGIAGKDGTLKYRFDGSDAAGRLRAKTGTLETVSALAGYVKAAGGERFAFAIFVNDFTGRAGTVVPSIDAIGAAVAALGSSGGPSAAVAALKPPSVVGPFAELKQRLKTYVGLAQQGERRNVALLRTAWRSEKDPAVRAIIADALYQSDPREPSNVHVLLDSALASEDVYGRIKKASAEAGFSLPVLPSLVELAAAGNIDAASRLFEFVNADQADEKAQAWLAEQLAVVATDAPRELLLALKSTPEAQLGPVVDCLVRGMVKAAHPDAPLWDVLRQSEGAADPAMVLFARSLEATLSVKIAEARAPGAARADGEPASGNSEPVPGG